MPVILTAKKKKKKVGSSVNPKTGATRGVEGIKQKKGKRKVGKKK